MSLTSAETQKLSRFLNPWALHLQKLGLELKCPLCLGLLNKPMLLPCNHIFCNGCVPKETQLGSECPACKHRFDDKDVRPAPFIENMATIYKSLDATFSTTLLQPLLSDSGMLSRQSPVSFTETIEDKRRRELVQNPQHDSRNGLSSMLSTNKNKNVSLNACSGKSSASADKTEKNMSSDDAQKEGVEQHGRFLRDSNSENQSSSFQQVRNTDVLQTEEIDINHRLQLSPDSSSSFSDMKDMGKNSSGSQRRNESAVKYMSRKSVENESVTARDEHNFRTTCDDLFQARDAKRQKKLSYELPNTGAQSYGQAQQGSSTEDIAISNCNTESKFGQQSPDTSRSVCAFCHSSKLTDGSGPMLYYANGKELVGYVNSLSKVISVHRKCIEWTPKVYYEGDNIKNLEPELARAGKLKCSGCGIKGAALGCFAKSCRRTYHVPCAFDIKECRWDCDDYLLLCPSHNNAKFPREKSNRVKNPREKSKSGICSREEKHLETNLTSSKQSDFWAALPTEQKEWVLCGSALSSEYKYHLVKFASMCGATVTKNWKQNVTHVIAATDANGACSRTFKVLMAILHGRWILTMDWVKACMEANCPLNEEPYEVCLDNHGCCDGPKTGRLKASANEPKLFDGLRFYFSGDFVQAYKYDLFDLVRTAGGLIIESKEQLMAESPQATSSSIIVYNRDPPQGCVVGEEGTTILQRLAEAEDLANQTGSKVVRHTWILESIAACKLLPCFC